MLNTAGVTAFCNFFVPQGTEPPGRRRVAALRGPRGHAARAVLGRHARPLLDDSLFMAPRWLAAGNVAELALYPGACHGFASVPFAQRDQAVARMSAFVDRHL